MRSFIQYLQKRITKTNVKNICDVCGKEKHYMNGVWGHTCVDSEKHSIELVAKGMTPWVKKR